MQSTINLLKPVKDNQAQLATIKEEARKVTLIVFLAAAFIGVILFIANIALSASLQTVLSTNGILKKQLEEEKVKESMLSVVKNRIQVVNKAVQYSKPIDKAIEMLQIKVPMDRLVSLQYDDLDVLTVRFRPFSIGDSMAIASGFLSLYGEGKIKKPKIDSYGVSPDGVLITISFVPAWDKI